MGPSIQDLFFADETHEEVRNSCLEFLRQVTKGRQFPYWRFLEISYPVIEGKSSRSIWDTRMVEQLRARISDGSRSVRLAVVRALKEALSTGTCTC
jgi:hypothetical protein